MSVDVVDDVHVDVVTHVLVSAFVTSSEIRHMFLGTWAYVDVVVVVVVRVDGDGDGDGDLNVGVDLGARR